MSNIVTGVFVIALAFGANAMAAQSGSGTSAQNNKMIQCSAAAKEKGLKADARKEFMSQCLRSPAAQAAAKACRADAKGQGLKGAKRRAFIRDCVNSRKASDMG
jgi:hypothetical protein